MNNSNNDNTGRSMVEMLGVLAIIGVLSAGALAGYSKAMFRHRVNQTIDTFQGVLQRFIELDQKGLGKDVVIGEDGDGTATDIVKYGLLPDCQATSDGGCQLPIGTLWMDFVDNGSYINGEFYIDFTDSKSCIAFASAGWENAIPIEWYKNGGDIEIGIVNSDDYIEISTQANIHSEMSEIVSVCSRPTAEGYRWYLTVREGL